MNKLSLKQLPITRTHLSLAAGALLLAACGGGGDGASPAAPTDPAAVSQIPASATTSSAGAFAFVSSVAATPDNTAEPLVVGDVTLATSDTDEPDASI